MIKVRVGGFQIYVIPENGVVVLNTCGVKFGPKLVSFTEKILRPWFYKLYRTPRQSQLSRDESIRDQVFRSTARIRHKEAAFGGVVLLSFSLQGQNRHEKSPSDNGH
jgi:hypothetical protein